MKTLTLFFALLMSALAAAETVKNPLGFVFDLPEGWTVAGTQDVYQVIRRKGQTENELYIVGGMLAMGAESASDPSLLEEDEKLMKQLGPWHRANKPMTFEGKSGSSVYEKFQGSSGGVDFDGHLFTSLVQEKRCGLLAVVPQNLTEELAKELVAIGASFRSDPDAKPGANSDAEKEWVSALAGYKFVRSTANDSGSLNGSGGSAGEKTLILYRDGTFYYASTSMSFVSAGEFSASSESKDEDNGRWSIRVEGQKVYLVLKSSKGQDKIMELGTKANYVTMDGRVFDRVRP